MSMCTKPQFENTKQIKELLIRDGYFKIRIYENDICYKIDGLPFASYSNFFYKKTSKEGKIISSVLSSESSTDQLIIEAVFAICMADEDMTSVIVISSIVDQNNLYYRKGKKEAAAEIERAAVKIKEF